MEILTLANDDNNILVTKCPEYEHTKLAEDIASATEMMPFIMSVRDGIRCVGLSAPQVGISRRFFIMFDKEEGHILFCADPHIVKHGKDVEFAKEGCFSCPAAGLVAIPRWKIIDVEYTDEAGRLRKRTFRGFTARVFQHEYDHLDGLLIVKTKEVENAAG